MGGNGWIDPNGCGNGGGLRYAFDEALRVGEVCSLQHLLTVLSHSLGLTRVERHRYEQPDTTMMVVVIIPVEESLAEGRASWSEPNCLGKQG